MHWMRNLFSNTRDTNRRNNAQNEIVSTISKIETQTQAIPKQSQLENHSDLRIQLPETTAKFDISDSSKVDNRSSSRTRPNNPEIRALVDRVTRTIDSAR